ncbi:MAG: phosphate ABC transporter substrate-binding protein [Solirubrobacteraceae bacterium]|nr:phosphate ABC transporter substrate-binding protein [Solirubrobacteraceae bacterium]
MRKLSTSVAFVAAGALAFGAPAAPAAAAKKTTITLSGSTSVAPLSSLLIQAYLKGPGKGKVIFRQAQGGSDVGISDVARGRVSIGNSSRDYKSSDPGGITFNPIAKDALCVVVNSGNTLTNLTTAQIQSIYSGKVRDWADVPGSGRTGTINLVTRTAASGTKDAFQKIFLGSAVESSAAAAKASSGLVAAAVEADPNAIGYVSLDFASKLKTLGYNGVTCNLQNAKTGEYGGVRNFWMVTRGKATGEIAKFITWIKTSPQAKKIVSTEWVPLS